MPEEQEITPYSLCDDCPCICHTASYNIIVLCCGKRAKHEAPEAKEKS